MNRKTPKFLWFLVYHTRTKIRCTTTRAFWLRLVEFGFGKISCTVSVGSPVQFRFLHPPAEYPCPRSKLNTVLPFRRREIFEALPSSYPKWKAPMFHPVVKSACSYLNCSFCPHCFFPPVFVVFAIRHDVYYHKPKEKSTKFPAYSAQRGRQKIVYDTNQKASPHVALCGAFVEKGKPLGENKNHAGQRATQRLYEPAAPFGALVLGYGFWITVRSSTPIQIRRRFRTPHRKGHRRRFPFP